MRKLCWMVTTALGVLLLSHTDAWAKPIPAEVQAKLREWYARYLGRMPEPAAIEFWGAKLADARHTVDVEASILASAEYYDRHGRNPASFVRGLYRDVIGTEPAPGQVDFWVSKAYEVRERDKFLREFMDAARKLPTTRAATPTVLPPGPGPLVTPPASQNPARATPALGTPKPTVPQGFTKQLPAYQRD